MNNRISQRDLAQLAGVSPMTISLALRGHPSISAATRARIVKLAERHNYRPDPALAALNAYRIENTPARFQGTLGWLTCFPTPNADPGCGYLFGAKQRAESLGYRLEEFWMAEPGLTARRATQILLARGVRGLIVAPLPSAHGEIPLDWKHFSSVALGYSLIRPQLHVVMNHQYRNMKHTVHQLSQLGYRRIGLAMPKANDERVDHNYLSGFLIAQRESPSDSTHLCPCFLESFNRTAFLKWFHKKRPDVMIVTNIWAYSVIEWLEEEGIKVPADVGVAVASTIFGDKKISGIDENKPLIGEMAVNTVVGMIHRNEQDIPTQPWSILAEGFWSAGQSVCQQKIRNPA